MSRISISTKLYLVCSFLIGCMVIIATVSVLGLRTLREQSNRVATVELPAVRNMSLADMMHDGIRAAVFRSMLLADGGTTKDREESAAEFEEMAGNLKKYLKAIDDLDIETATRKAIADARPEVDAYVEEGRHLVKLTVDGKYRESVSGMDKFQKSFEALEAKLEVLGEKLESNGADVAAAGDGEMKADIGLTVVFILLGMILSSWAIRDLIRALRAQLSTLRTEQGGVNESADSMNQLAQYLTHSSEEQASALEETAASVAQIDAMVRRNASDATQAKDISDRSAKVAQDGKHSVETMLQAINEMRESNERIVQQIADTNTKITEMVNRFQEIGKKTEVINDIVFQTRLLSFNASVEAARAGEHGKGFAVVAEEVGNLAAMSGNAAKEISEMLQNNTTWVNQVAETSRSQIAVLVVETKEKIERGISVARDCERLLEEVVKNAIEVTDRSNSIAVASTEQSQGVSEINKAVGQLVQLNTKNSKISQDAAGSAAHLSTSSNSLANVVSDLSRIVDGTKAA